MIFVKNDRGFGITFDEERGFFYVDLHNTISSEVLRDITAAITIYLMEDQTTLLYVNPEFFYLRQVGLYKHDGVYYEKDGPCGERMLAHLKEYDEKKEKELKAIISRAEAATQAHQSYMIRLKDEWKDIVHSMKEVRNG